jgi:xylulokinase
MGVVMSATAALDWTARLTGRTAAELAGMAETSTQIADAPVFLPCLNGLRTPANRPAARARIDGLHPGVDAALMGYATMEGVAFQVADCVAAQRAVGARPERFLAVGGGTRSGLWMRLLATALEAAVELPEGADLAGPAGAARLALVAAGAVVSVLSLPRRARAVIDPDPALARLLPDRRAIFARLMA